MESDIKKVLLLSLIGHLLSVGIAGSNGLTAVTECICPGHNVVYQCTVTGGLFTVWGGTALQCAGGSITLRHSGFGSVSSPAVGECNNGQIIGRGISQENNCYISQLNITLSEGLVGETVTCGVDSGSLTPVGSIILATSTRPLMPPNNVSMNVTSHRITFLWEHVSDIDNCPGLYYNITSVSNCGTCPPGTEMSQITCSDFSIPGSGIACTLTIQTVVCWGTDVAVSGSTTSVTLFLKMPDAPDLSVIPFYQQGLLAGINISFSKNRFSLSDFVDGSPISFTITYADTTGDSCGLNTIILTNSTACMNDLCTHYSTDICFSTRTIITAFGSNVLGNGNNSTKQINYRSSNFVTIGTNLTPRSKQIICTFQGPIEATLKICEISIADGMNCKGPRRGSNNSTVISGDTVSIDLNNLINDADEGRTFCYNLTARAGTEEVVVQDSIVVVIIKDTSPQNIAVAVFIPIIVISSVLLAVLIIIAIIVLQPKKVEVKAQKCVTKVTDMEELGKELIGDDYDHLLGYGFFKAKEHDRIPMSKGVIARDGQKVYKAGYIIQKAFVNKYGKIRSRNKRIRGYRGDDWDLFVPTAGKKTLHQGDEFLYCPDANIREYDYDSESDSDDENQGNVPVGVIKVQNWHYLYVHICDATSRRMTFTTDRGELIKNGIDEQKVYHEEYYIDETEDSIRPADKIPKEIKVMAMRDDGKWFNDAERKLLENPETKYDFDRNIFQPPRGWKHLFFMSKGYRVLANSNEDKILFNDPSLLLVPARSWHMFTVTAAEKSLTDLISKKLNKRRPAHILRILQRHIYVEKQPDKIEDNDVIMALDKDYQLCTSSNARVNTLIKCKDYDKVWQFVFVQVVTDNTPLFKEGARVLYCKYQRPNEANSS